MTGVLIKSSNVGTQWVAGKLGADRFYEYLRAFGFGSLSGVRLPGEAEGTLRTYQSEGWTRIDLATNSYGQGVAVTPLQMLAAFASLGNDGLLMRPRLVREVRGPDGIQPVQPESIRQAVSPRTARTIRNMLVEVAEQEALRAHRVPGYRIALKTGTSDVPTSDGYDTDRTYASVAALLPADDPSFAVLIRIDNPEGLYGGVAAAPVLKQLAQELFTHYRIPPTSPVPTPSIRN
jgi:cell division protein FtsI/penicillin-binding protein 2